MFLKIQSKSVLSGASLLAVALAATPSVALAQDDAGDIVVTARRVEERLQDVPISITVFNQSQLTNRNVVSAGDIATYTPSLSANGRQGPDSTSFAIRGFVQEGPTSPSVGTYFAEVVSPRANGGTTAGNGAGPGAFFDLANVQVLKGPQGTLFGRNTTGGAVLLTPQRPTGRLEGYVEGSLGNYDLQRVQGVVNIPVMDTLRIRVGVDRQTRDGYLRNVSNTGPRDFNDIDYVAARFSAVADLTPNLENYTIISYSHSRTNGSLPKVAAIDTAFGAARSPTVAAAIRGQIASTSGDYYDVSNGHPNPFTRIEQWQLINTTTWKASDTITIKNIASYSEFRQTVAANNNGDNFLPGFASVSLFGEPGKNNVSQSSFTEELQLQGRSGDDRLSYQVGAYLELSEPVDGFQVSRSAIFLTCTDIYSLQCGGQGGQVALSRSKYRFRNLGVYAQGTYKLTDQLSVTAGIRYTSDVTRGIGEPVRVTFPTANVPNYECSVPSALLDNRTVSTSAQIQNNPSLCSYTRRVASAKPTWLLGADFKPADDILLYAKYARGYRQGSVNVSNYGLESWEPERVDTYEIGAKTSFDGFVRGSFNVAAFYNDFSNQQLQIQPTPCVTVTGPGTQCPFIPSPGQGIANAGKSTIKGVEVDASVRLFEGFNVDVGYAHLDTKLKTVTLPAPPVGYTRLNSVNAGDPLALAPRNKYSVTGSYTLPLSPDIGRITLGATFTHQDSSLGQPSSFPALIYLPPQDNLNLNVNWNSVAGAPVDLALFATNVTKERYHLFTTGGISSFGFDSIILNQPQMYGVRLKYRFGS